MVAVRNNNAELVNMLVNAGAKLNLRNRHGETAIMLASYRGLGKIVENLYLKRSGDQSQGLESVAIRSQRRPARDYSSCCWKAAYQSMQPLITERPPS